MMDDVNPAGEGSRSEEVELKNVYNNILEIICYTKRIEMIKDGAHLTER